MLNTGLKIIRIKSIENTDLTALFVLPIGITKVAIVDIITAPIIEINQFCILNKGVCRNNHK